MRYATACSGIGAPEHAFRDFGWKHVFCAEIEAFPCAVLKHHYPNTPNYGDITKFREWPGHLEPIDLLVGGTPCQSFSVAGLRAGLADPRGNVALTFLAIAQRYRPQWVVWENVPGVHSSWSDAEDGHTTEASAEAESVVRRLALEAGIDGETIERLGGFEECEQTSDFDSFLAGLAELGYGIASRVYDAQYFDLAQRRERVFVVGCAGGQWQRAAAVLFDSESLRGNPPPRRPPAQGTAPTLAARTRGGRGLGTDAECGGALIARPLLGKANSSHDESEETYVTHSLRSEGADASEDGTGRGTPLILEVAPTMRSGGNKTGGDRPPGTDVDTCETLIPLVIAHGQGHAERVSDGEPSLTCNHEAPILFTQKDHGADAGEISPTLRGMAHDKSNANGGGQVAIQQGYAVRRLTPRECERLQGFSDDYTAIPYRCKPAAADGPRYKALGNSMAVPVLRYIGERIRLNSKL